MKTVDISIIIRTLNEEKYLPYLLNKISKQSLFGSSETIIIDSGSNDSTLSIANDYDAKIFNIKKKDFTFGKSLNLGCKFSKGKYLVFISGHCIPLDNKWLENLIHPLSENICGYSYGRQIGSKSTYFSEAEIFKKYYPNSSNLHRNGYFCNNANSAMLKTIWEEYKFDEQITGLEDLHLSKRIFKDGMNISYVAEACVFHCHKESWPQISRRFEREAYALLKISPEIKITKFSMIYYIICSILIDYKKAFSKGVLFKNNNLRNIFLYRCYQYYGSYKGNKNIKKYNQGLTDRYFFPSKSFITNEVNSKSDLNKKEKKLKIVALLPMKLNSTRVKGKNFKQFAERPLYSWILKTLINVNYIDEIIINTDAKKILKQDNLISHEKIRIVDRPLELCGDHVSMNKIIQYDLSNTLADVFVMTHTTNPLLSESTINACIDEFLIKSKYDNYDSLFTVNSLQTRFYSKKGNPLNHDPKKLIPTQELEVIYEENSNLYIFSKSSFISTNSRIGKNPIMFPTPATESLDIDTQMDWEIAESIALYRKRKEC